VFISVLPLPNPLHHYCIQVNCAFSSCIRLLQRLFFTSQQGNHGNEIWDTQQQFQSCDVPILLSVIPDSGCIPSCCHNTPTPMRQLTCWNRQSRTPVNSLNYFVLLFWIQPFFILHEAATLIWCHVRSVLTFAGCPAGFYGAGCGHKCRCYNNATCNIETGHCECSVGWTGARCNRGMLTLAVCYVGRTISCAGRWAFKVQVLVTQLNCLLRLLSSKVLTRSLTILDP
jgi:hypothetical protein